MSGESLIWSLNRWYASTLDSYCTFSTTEMARICWERASRCSGVMVGVRKIDTSILFDQ